MKLTQDNNSLIITDPGLSPSKIAYGGDGVFCFIDQDEPNIQIVSSQYGNYKLSIDGGLSFDLFLYYSFIRVYLFLFVFIRVF